MNLWQPAVKQYRKKQKLRPLIFVFPLQWAIFDTTDFPDCSLISVVNPINSIDFLRWIQLTVVRLSPLRLSPLCLMTTGKTLEIATS